MPNSVREFSTGATRNADDDKLDFEGFLSPYVLKRYAEYMHSHRKQADGRMRDSDNWQRGIPADVYVKSAWRHWIDFWSSYRGMNTPDDIETNACALLFNISGFLHERLKSNQPTGVSDTIQPTPQTAREDRDGMNRRFGRDYPDSSIVTSRLPDKLPSDVKQHRRVARADELPPNLAAAMPPNCDGNNPLHHVTLQLNDHQHDLVDK